MTIEPRIEPRKKQATRRPMRVAYMKAGKTINRVQQDIIDMDKKIRSTDAKQQTLANAKWAADTYGEEWGGDIETMENTPEFKQKKAMEKDIVILSNWLTRNEDKIFGLSGSAREERKRLPEAETRGPGMPSSYSNEHYHTVRDIRSRRGISRHTRGKEFDYAKTVTVEHPYNLPTAGERWNGDLVLIPPETPFF